MHKKVLIISCTSQTLGAVNLFCHRRHPHLHLYLLSLLPAQREVQTLWLPQLAVLLEVWRLLRAPCVKRFWSQKGTQGSQGADTFWLAQGSSSLPSFEAVVPPSGMTSVRCQQLAEQNSWRRSIFPGIAGLCLVQPESSTGPGTKPSIEAVWLTNPQLDVWGQIIYLWEQRETKGVDFPDSFM